MNSKIYLSKTWKESDRDNTKTETAETKDQESSTDFGRVRECREATRERYTHTIDGTHTQNERLITLELERASLEKLMWCLWPSSSAINENATAVTESLQRRKKASLQIFEFTSPPLQRSGLHGWLYPQWLSASMVCSFPQPQHVAVSPAVAHELTLGRKNNGSGSKDRKARSLQGPSKLWSEWLSLSFFSMESTTTFLAWNYLK